MMGWTLRIGAVLFTLSLSLPWPGPAGAQPANTPWAMFQQNLLNTGRSPMLGPRFPAGTPSTAEVKKWNAPDKIKMYPVLDSDGTIYVGMGFVFCAINPDMTKKWCTRLGADVSSSAAAIDRAGFIYVGDRDNSLTKFDRRGRIVWKFNHGFEGDVWASPKLLRDGTLVYAHDQTTDGIGVVTALNPADGSRKWFHVTGKGIRESPAVDASDNIYFSASSSILIYTDTGDLRWEVPVGHAGLSAPVIDTQRSVLYVGSTGGLVAIDVANVATTPPHVLWTTSNIIGKAGQPVLGTDGTLYLGSRLLKAKRLYAVDPDGNARLLYGPVQIEAAEPLRPILGADNVIYVGFGGRVYAFTSDGVALWHFDTANQIIDFFAIGKVAGKATLYAGSNDWKLYAITESGGATAGELLGNGGLEVDEDGDGVPDGWTVQADDNDHLVCDPAKVHSGSCAFRFKGDASAQGDSLKQVAVHDGDAGDVIKLKLFARAKNVAVGTAKIVLTVRDTTSGVEEKVVLHVPSGTYDYQKLSVSHTVGSSNAALDVYDRVIVTVKMSGGPGSQLYIDDAGLVVSPP